MALVDLKSNLANFRSEFKTPSVESQAVKKLNQPSAIKDKFPANDSNLDIDTTPDKFIAIGKSKLSNNKFIKTSVFNIDSNPELYNRKTKFTKRFVDRSEFNREDNFILKYTGRTRFTTKYVNSFSKFNIDTTPDKFIVSGFSKLSLPRFVNRSQFNIDSTLSKFSPTGVYLPSKFTNTKIINASKYNLDNSPNKHGNDSNKTNFKGISGRSFKFPNILTAVFRTNAVELKNSKFGSRGFATVENQLGAGSLFHYTIKGAKNNKLFSSRGYGEQLKYGDVIRGGRGSQESNSLLYRKATEQNSPSAIDEQYKKFNLRDEAFNYSYINHPLILRGIQRKGKENPNRWGIDKLVNFDSGLVRGGITAAVERAANDTARIAKWVASPKGLLWVVKQVGLGLSNPKVEAIGGALTRQTRIHTGVASLLSVPTTAFGLHFTRHGIPFLNETASYEKVIKTKQLINPKYSRLATLTTELLTKTNIPTPSTGVDGEPISKFRSVFRKAKRLITKALNVTGNTPILSLSGLGGPQSVYGIGATIIRRAVNSIPTIGVVGSDASSDSRPFAGKLKGFGSSIKTSNPNRYNAEDLEDLKLTTYVPLNKFLKWSIEKSTKSEISPYEPLQNTTTNQPDGDPDAKRLIDSHNPKKPAYYIGSKKASTGKPSDAKKDSEYGNLNGTVADVDSSGLKNILEEASMTTGDITLPNSSVLKTNPVDKKTRTDDTEHPLSDYRGNNIKSYAALSYTNIKKFAKERSENPAGLIDFRSGIAEDGSAKVPEFVGKQVDDYYKNNNLETRYGLAKSFNRDIQGSKVKARGEGSFIIKGQQFSGGEDAKGKPTKSTPWDLVNRDTYTGDKITGIDIIKSPTDPAKIYSNIKGGNTKDFIKFYFADGEMNNTTQVRRAMVFRATISGLSDTFSPNWGSIQIMGRPDSAYRYDSFERSISFEMKVYAMTRSEMIPMWRKLNYLASFTAPDFVGGYAAGPFMRLTLGDLYYNCPGFLESLSYTIPDESPWDIADDDDPDAKQLPMMVDVSVGYKIIGTHRPINMGRMYALGPNDSAADVPGQWLGNSNKYEDPGVDEGGFTKGTSDPENTTENTGFTGNQGLGQGDNNIA